MPLALQCKLAGYTAQQPVQAKLATMAATHSVEANVRALPPYIPSARTSMLLKTVPLRYLSCS
jgi:hypothetical protein